MENNNPKKSKAFIITFILILILLIVGYYLFKNRNQMFGAKGTTSISKIFSPLLGTSKDNPIKVVEDPNTKIPTAPVIPKKTGVVITDANGNKMVMSEAGEMLKKGDVLYIAGFNKNDQPIVMKAIANDKNKSLVFGVAGEDMNKGALGNVIIEGILTGVPTNRKEITLWKTKDTLFLSDKIYGGMTKNSPKSPSYIVPVGSVITVDPKNGSIRIGGLSDALTTNLEKLNLLLLGNSNMELIDSVISDLRDYWSSIFGDGLFGNIDYTSVGDITPGIPPLNPITLPGQNTNPNIPQINPNTGACKNGADNPVLCTTKNGVCLNGAKNPPACATSITNADTACSDKIDNDGDGFIDTLDPNCHVNGDLNNTYVPLHDSESTSPANPNADVINKCLLIDQNPLTFTKEEQSQLAELLRKFYLLAPKIKTTDDIETTYGEMTQYTSFISQIEDMTGQCYATLHTPGYLYPPVEQGGPGYDLTWGNPWYKYNTRGTYLTDEQGKGFCYGTIKNPGAGIVGTSCKIFTTGGSCVQINKLTGWQKDNGVTEPQVTETMPDYMTGCQWLEPRDYEKILNIW